MGKKTFHYYFRPAEDGAWAVTKFDSDDSEPEVTYYLVPRPRNPQGWMCDCPAAHRYAGEIASGERRDKHADMLLRYLKVRASKQVPDSTPIYYDTATDQFFPLTVMAPDAVENLLDKDEDNGV